METRERIKKVQEEISLHLQFHLKKNIPRHQSQEVYQYALLPPGKLIRPLFVRAIQADFRQIPLDYPSSPFDPETLFACAVEIHHAYTLIHDDLPCMDNDDFRRGKLTTHKAFGEWQALLAGDGLLNLSYRLISQIKNNSKLFSLFSWALGPKGLILGQWLDLQAEEEASFDLKIQLEIMKLKTARLMQASILGSLFLISPNEIKKEIGRPISVCFRIGHHIGLMFQLLDDLVDLAEQKDSLHEKEINPFINYPSDSFLALEKSLSVINNLTRQNSLTNLRMVLSQLYQKTTLLLIANKKFLETEIKINLDPIVLALNSLN